jgi:hypothetical protein
MEEGRMNAHSAMSLEEIAADSGVSEVSDDDIIDVFVDEFGGTRTDAERRLREFMGTTS